MCNDGANSCTYHNIKAQWWIIQINIAIILYSPNTRIQILVTWNKLVIVCMHCEIHWLYSNGNAPLQQVDFSMCTCLWNCMTTSDFLIHSFFSFSSSFPFKLVRPGVSIERLVFAFPAARCFVHFLCLFSIAFLHAPNKTNNETKWEQERDEANVEKINKCICVCTNTKGKITSVITLDLISIRCD